MTPLADCYRKIHNIAEGSIDSLAVAEAVDSYRQYWKPQNVRVVLLAESHVFTSDAELNQTLRPDIHGLQDCPSQFTRFVYCLGYGENELLHHPVKGNSGTWQFWKLLFACCNRTGSDAEFTPILKTRTRDLRSRIRNRIELLRRLQSMGVWLIDASIVGLYNPGGKRPSPSLVESVLRCSWENYVRDVVADAKPSFLICIGQGVGRILDGDLRSLMGNRFVVVNQPQARMTTAELEQTHRTYFEVCHRYAHPGF